MVGWGLTCSMGAREERQSLREQSMRNSRGREKLSPGEGNSITGGESACGTPAQWAPPFTPSPHVCLLSWTLPAAAAESGVRAPPSAASPSVDPWYAAPGPCLCSRVAPSALSWQLLSLTSQARPEPPTPGGVPR